MTELTIDKCVLVHCDSTAQDAHGYRSNSLAFLDHWKRETSIVACVNGGIRREYDSFPKIGAIWWRSVVGQSRYLDMGRAVISQSQRIDFRKRQNIPLHREDFDYVDAASQSNSRMWLSNEASWQNDRYRRRIKAAFQIEIQNVNEYMNGVSGQGTAEVS